MVAFRFALAATLAFASCAHAQLLDPPSTVFGAQPSTLARAYGTNPLGPFYMRNEAEHPDSDLQQRYRSDPRFVGGLTLNPFLSLEAGYLELFDRGYHKVAEGDQNDASGALAVNGFNSFAAAKVALPLTDNLSIYGKLGVAYSERRGRASARVANLDEDVGLYTKFGAQYKLTDKTSLNLESQSIGHTAQKWGKGTGNYFRPSLNMQLR